MSDVPWSPYVATMLASATCGMMARIPCHPIDTAKARLQVQTRSSSAQYKSVFDVITKTFRNEGLRGLYRGFGITFFGSAPAACLYFTTYEVSKDTMTKYIPFCERYPFVTHFMAGMLAESLSCVLWVPIDVIKERMQIQHPPRGTEYNNPSAWAGYYRNTVDAATQIMRYEGIRGVYKGYGATIASFGPFSALYFLFYEQCKSFSRKRLQVEKDHDLPYWVFLSTSSLSGAAASWITNPLDLAKLRLQVQRASTAKRHALLRDAPMGSGAGTVPFSYRHTLDALRVIFVQEGLRGLFRGSVARVMFSVPATAITMSLFEQFKKLYTTLLGPEAR